MKVLADTSVLVAALVETHPEHARSFPWLRRARQKEITLVVANHSLAELYAVLTTLPLSPRISPGTARRMIRQDIETTATLAALQPRDYKQILDYMAELDLSGGIIYDLLAIWAAKKAKADRLLTLNPNDFRRAWPDGKDIIAEP